ncbi:hypothetical protein BEL04_21205 [Mucilaginibacter sp. PPCGB 2223]|uniref:head GIN domain-containing protein n=1 Tax=Mucilaginibacter sp. PPCGB 2223 TaxID=1886027 RepID=UPI000826D213|nr:head GIN domain-containing protein [Mucilaginibacter sp. PPCGB 2223]OCX51223.1 hypothetical protein BEL04_21205 [Mucilaginibacter sp. PPCGB 2223]
MKVLNRILAITVAVMVFVTLTTKAADVDDRHLSGFNAINLSASYDVYITQGAAESVKVDAAADEQERIVTEVRGGVLYISGKEHGGMHWDWGGKKRVVYVVVKDINSISISGSGDVFFKSGINTNAMHIKVSGSGDVNGRLNAKTAEIEISGSGDVKLYGRADNSNVRVSGSGDFSGRDLVTNTTTVRVVGSGDATVNASTKIDASVSGSGDITYTGGAHQVSTSKSGSGDIHRM